MQWLALTCTFLSIYLMGKKSLYGPLAGLCGSALWIWYALVIQDDAVLLVNLGIGILTLRTLWLWYKDK